MILCDTNILIELYKNNASVIYELRRITHHRIVISVITQAELYFGALNKKELNDIQKHLSTITILPVTHTISCRFVLLMEQYALSHKISIPDAILAATALENDCEFYTLNTKDFQFIDNLRLYSGTEPTMSM